jgi:tetratricopeptide (TPR) repeat protein
MPKKKRHSQPPTVSKTPQHIVDALEKADDLMSKGNWLEARTILEPLHQRYPQRYDVLAGLSNVYHALQDEKGYLDACEKLVKLAPRDPDIALMLAGAYLRNAMPALALQTFQKALDRWPDHDRADEVREIIAGLDARLDVILADLGVSGDQGFEIARLHDEARSLMAQGRYAESRHVGEQLLRIRPSFAPALNNISLSYGIEGRLDQAITTAQKVLEFDPDNYHALGNLVRFCCLRGQLDEAGSWADQLKRSMSAGPDSWLKKAEAFSFLGDDQAVLDAFEGARRDGHLELPYGGPMLYHLAAVASLRLGRNEARRLWQQALDLAPGFTLAHGNLDDLLKPIGQRHAPWPFPFSEWMTQKNIHDLVAQIQPATRRGTEGAITQAARRYLKQHPEMASLIPLLFDRGDPTAREHALRLAMVAEMPELLTALRDFAFSQRGPDAMRMQAAQAAFQAGALPSRRATLWIEGEWREIGLMSYRLHNQPVVLHSPQVERLLARATVLLRQNKPAEAEALLRQGLAIEPDAPDLLNNLAVAYGGQGRNDEAEALLHQIIERHPNYVFARVSMARTYILRRRFAEARALLEPLMEQERFHFSEFANFCTAQVELSLAERNHDAARTWLDLWANVDPDNPAIAVLRERVDRPSLRQRIFGGRT